MPRDEFPEVWCCCCERLTTHRYVEDSEVFDLGLECLVCHTEWEAEEVYPSEARSNTRKN